MNRLFFWKFFPVHRGFLRFWKCKIAAQKQRENFVEKFQKCCAWARQNIQIAHHIPGRIRLKFGAPAGLDVDFSTLKKVFEKMPSIQNLKVNLLARSMTIQYDAKRLPPAAFDDFLAGKDNAAALAFEKDFQQSFQNFV